MRRAFAILLCASPAVANEPTKPVPLAAQSANQLIAQPPAPPRRPDHVGFKTTSRSKADPFAGWISIEPRRWPVITAPSSTASLVPDLPAKPSPSACILALAARGIIASPAIVISPIAGCMVEEPVRMRSVGTAKGSVELAGEPLLACAMALKVGEFIQEVAAPLMLGTSGSDLRKLHVGGGHECRPRNRVAGAKMSAHGRGLALDIMAIELADGRRIAVSDATMSGGRVPLEGLRAAACGYFLTVLGPGSDNAHDDHLHIDIEQHGSSDRTRLCQ